MKNRTLIGIVAIALAAILVFVAAPIINSISAEKMEVVQLNSIIPEGRLITSDDVVIVEIGKLGVSDSVITKQDAVIGQYAASTLYPNTNLVPSMFTESNTTATNVLANMDKDHVAISVSVKSFASALSAKIQNGDIVTAIVSDNSGTYIPEALKYIKVITTTALNGFDTDQMNTTEDGVPTPATITLYVTPYQAKLLASYEVRANMHFTLACRADSENAVEFLSEQENTLKTLMEDEAASQKSNTPMNNTAAAPATTAPANSETETGGENNG